MGIGGLVNWGEGGLGRFGGVDWGRGAGLGGGVERCSGNSSLPSHKI